MSGIRVVRRGGMQRYRPPVLIGGLAMPQGPAIIENTAILGGRQVTSGFAQAADFYDSVGLNHHAYLIHGTGDIPTAVDRLQELGLRHVRHGLYTPAMKQNESPWTAQFVAEVRSRPLQLYFLWGTDVEPASAGGSVATYKIGTPTDTNPDDTALRSLDGRTGNIAALTNWPASSPYYPNAIKYFPGAFADFGWESVAAFQGPNEPDARNPNATQTASMRNEVHAAFTAAKNARPTEVILGGDDYLDSATGRIAAGPAYAPQAPVVGSPPRQGASDAFYATYGDYTLTNEIDVGSKHVYFEAHHGQPSYRSVWEKSTQSAISSGKGWPGLPSFRYRTQSYNGRLGSAIYNNELPYFVTEIGSVQAEASAGSGVYYPQDVMGEYFCRYLVQNYLGGARRTYLMKLNDEPGSSFPAGICGTDWHRRASFYALKNLLAHVRWTQGTTSQQITVTNNFTTDNNAHNLWASGGAAGYWDFDGLQQLVLQQDDGYLVILIRSRVLWDVVNQAYKTVADPKTVTITFPSGFSSASIAEPSKTNLQSGYSDPNDGQTYPNPGDGMTYQPLTISGGNSVTLGTTHGGTFIPGMAGLTRVIKLTA